MATETAGPTPRVPSRWRQWVVLTWFLAFVVCFAAAVLLGLSYAGHPLVPGAAGLLAPAGGLLLPVALLQLTGRAHLEGVGPGGTRTGFILLAAALALLGAGIWTMSHTAAWRILCLPAIAWTFLGLARALLHRPARSSFFQRARRRGGPLWMWQAYLGAWIIVLVAPVGVAWSLGIINIR